MVTNETGINSITTTITNSCEELGIKPARPCSEVCALLAGPHMFGSRLTGILWCLTPFFNSISVISWRPVHPPMIFWSSFNQYSVQYSFQATGILSHISIVSGERGMNPVAMTMINPWKEYWPSQGSNQQPHVLKSCTLPTQLWGSALI